MTSHEIALTFAEKFQNEYPNTPIHLLTEELRKAIDEHVQQQVKNCDLANVVIPFSEIETAANNALEKTRRPPNPTTTDRELMLGRRAFINGAIWYRDALKRK